MPSSANSSVIASADAADDVAAFDEVLQVWTPADLANRQRVLRALKEDDRWSQKQERESEQARAQREARRTEPDLRDDLTARGIDVAWNLKRALDLQDFSYLFLHRSQFDPNIKTLLEIVSSKINHYSQNGEPSYFNKLEQNIGWTPYITPLIFSRVSTIDKLVRCGIWSNAKNSRRCHQTEFCALCLWNDQLKALVSAFGRHSGAFSKAQAWFFITIGWTTNPANPKCRCDDFDLESLRPHAPNRDYEPYPVVLGLNDQNPDAPVDGYEDARTVGVVMQWAIAELYHRGYINGYHSRHEGEYRLNPGGANRVNFHDHTVANGDEADGQFIAEKLLELLNAAWALYGRDHLHRTYYPDIHVRRITGPDHLHHAICYGEKVVPIGHAVADALARPEAKGADGFYDLRYIAKLTQSLARLVADDIPAIFSGAQLHEALPHLFRRRTEGNMRFNDAGTCIGPEPAWHAKKRHKAAKCTRAARKRRQEREQKLREAGVAVPARKRNPRRRQRSRRLPRVK